MSYQKGKARKQPHLKSHQKYIGINLTKEVKDLYSENYKTLMKETEDDTKKGKAMAPSWMRRVLLKCPYCPKQSTDLMQSLSKYPWHFPQNLEQIILKFIWNHKDKAILRKKEQSWSYHAQWFQTMLQSYSIKTVAKKGTKQMHRSVEQNRVPRNKAMYIMVS